MAYRLCRRTFRLLILFGVMLTVWVAFAAITWRWRRIVIFGVDSQLPLDIQVRQQQSLHSPQVSEL